MELMPGDVQIRKGTLVVQTREIDADDISDLTYWARDRVKGRMRKRTKELTHLFELVVHGETVKFGVQVQPHAAGIAKRQASMAASIVSWLQANVEGRVRQRLIDEALAGELKLGALVLGREGFGSSSVVPGKGPEFPWSRFRKAHVSLDSIDIVVNVDDPDHVAYAFSVKRSVLNTCVLPEVMTAVKEAAAGTT